MDAILTVLTVLQANSTVIALIGRDPVTNNPAVYGGQLPEHYNPEVASTAEPAGNGPAIVLSVKGGTIHSEMPLQEVDVQLVVWTGVNENQSAHAIYQACITALHGLTYPASGVKRILATLPGSDLTDPETGWATVVGAFNVMGF